MIDKRKDDAPNVIWSVQIAASRWPKNWTFGLIDNHNFLISCTHTHTGLMIFALLWSYEKITFISCQLTSNLWVSFQSISNKTKFESATFFGVSATRKKPKSISHPNNLRKLCHMIYWCSIRELHFCQLAWQLIDFPQATWSLKRKKPGFRCHAWLFLVSIRIRIWMGEQNSPGSPVHFRGCCRSSATLLFSHSHTCILL